MEYYVGRHRDAKICYYIQRRLEYDFLACLRLCLASYFSFFLFFLFLFLFPASRYVYLLRVPSSLQLLSSHLLLSANTYFIVRVLSACCHLYPTPSRNSFVLYSFGIFFRSSYFSGGFFCCCALVPGTLALDFPTLNPQRSVFAVSLSVTTKFVSLQHEESGRTLGVLLMMSLGRKNGFMWRQQQQ